MRPTKNIRRNVWLLMLFALPASAAASVQITELMYNLEGADNGFEWVEITNTGSTAVDVGKWRLFEGDTNHTLELAKGESTLLLPGGSAVIADNPEKFLVHWPGVGVVFNSAFSLSNTGETLTLKNAKLEVADQVSYTTALGAAGDSGSLQRLPAQAGQGDTFVAALPTPGVFPGEVKLVPKKQHAASTAKSPDLKPTSSGLAAVANAQPRAPFFLLPWLLGLASITALGVAGVLFSKTQQTIEETKSPADEFEIIENNSKSL